MDAARGQMVNRYMTPRGQVWKWDFGKMGFWGSVRINIMFKTKIHFVIPKIL
jgi:hypothetical protein